MEVRGEEWTTRGRYDVGDGDFRETITEVMGALTGNEASGL